MLGVMALGNLLGDGPELGGNQTEFLALQAADHLAGQAPLNAVGLHNDKGAVHEKWTLHSPRASVSTALNGRLPPMGTDAASASAWAGKRQRPSSTCRREQLRPPSPT